MTAFRKKLTLRKSSFRNSLQHESLETRQLLAFDFAGTAAFSQADLTNDGVLDYQDIDSLTAGLRSGSQSPEFDLNGDGLVNRGDHRHWVVGMKKTTFGDADLDGQFGTGDLVQVFQQGKYEDSSGDLAGWRDGDWDGNGAFGTGDLIAAFQMGDFELGVRQLAEPVIRVDSNYPSEASFTVSLSGDPHFMLRVKETGFEAEADVMGQASITIPAIGNSATIEFGDVNGNEGSIIVDLNGPLQSASSLHQYAPWGALTPEFDLEGLPPSIVTAFTPAGITRLQLADAALRKHDIDAPPRYVGVPEDHIDVSETDAEVQSLTGFGGSDGLSPGAVIEGVLGPGITELFPVEDDGDFLKATETGLSSTPNEAVFAQASIGDGPYGSSGAGSGDFDFYAVRNMLEDQILTIDINTPVESELDSIVYVWNASGQTVDVNDNSGGSSDSFLEFRVPSDGDYFVSVGGFGSFIPVDPFDSSSGFGADSEGDYDILLGVDIEAESDSYQFDLQVGDIIGGSSFGGANHLTFRDSEGNELIGSGQDITSIHPASSPLPGGGNASFSWVVSDAGTYQLDVDGGAGDYEIQLGVFRPALEGADRFERQILFLDFDGATLNAEDLFGLGNPQANLSPLVDYLPGWGLTAEDEDQVIDAIADVVRENFQFVAENGVNGDFQADRIDGHYAIDVVTSRDSVDALGFPVDPFGTDNVSRVVIGGTMEQLGIQTIGIAESIDVGNFDTTETGVVLLDLLSADSDPNSLNSFDRAETSTMIDLIGVAVGNIVTHEAGHFLASWHTDQFNALPMMMDQGGNMPNTIGLGDDGIFGTADDVNVQFLVDSLVANEGFSGVQNSLDAVSLGLSTGLVDPGMLVISSSPESDSQLNAIPDRYVLEFIDPYQAVPAPDDFEVNGIAATSVIALDAYRVEFSFVENPVSSDGLQQMTLLEGAVARASDNDDSAAFEATFGVNASQMQVLSVTPPEGNVSLPFNRIEFVVDEPYLSSSINAEDLLISQGQVSDVEFVDDVTFAFLLEGVDTEGLFTAVLPDDAIADASGNRGSGVSVNYQLDIVELPLNAPEEVQLPRGSAAYETSMAGIIGPGDVDAFRFLMDPGQTLVVVLEPSDELQGEVRLLNGDRVVDARSAGAPGERIVLQTTETRGNLVGRRENLSEFVVQVRGFGDSTGDYEVQVLINADLELARPQGIAESDPASAQSLESSLLQLGANGAERAAVRGELVGNTLYREDFEAGTLGAEWTLASTRNTGSILATEEFGAAEGEFALIMDNRGALDNLNEAILQVDLSAAIDPVLSFDLVNFGDERHPFAGSFEGQFLADGIAISDDGLQWFPVFDSPDTPPGEWRHDFVELADPIAEHGLSAANLQIKFQQYDNLGIPVDGRGWDNIAITEANRQDWYSINAIRGDTLSAAIDSSGDYDMVIDLFDANGNLVADGIHVVRPLQNGSFESGDFRGWTVETTGETNTPWQVTGVNSGGNLFIDETTPQDGEFVAWNGFDGNGPTEYRMYQDVFIPAGVEVADFSWQHRIQWAFFVQEAEARTMDLEIVDPNTEEVLDVLYQFSTGNEVENPSGDTGWLTLNHDLTAYAGSRIRILFTQAVPEVYTGPAQVEFDGMSINVGQQLPTNVDDSIADYLVTTSGTYLIRVTGELLQEYGLVATINAEFGLEMADGDAEQAQPILSGLTQGRRWVMGDLDPSRSDTDTYEIALEGGRPFGVETLTPADGIGLFTNDLDPRLRLYDAEGNLVAEDDNSSPDGRNAQLRYQVPRGEEGTYFIEVARAAESSGGEYILRLQGADLPLNASLAAAALVENESVETDEDVASDSTDEILGSSAQAVDLAFEQHGDAIESTVERDLVDDYLDGLFGELAVDSLS